MQRSNTAFPALQPDTCSKPELGQSDAQQGGFILSLKGFWRLSVLHAPPSALRVQGSHRAAEC